MSWGRHFNLHWQADYMDSIWLVQQFRLLSNSVRFLIPKQMLSSGQGVPGSMSHLLLTGSVRMPKLAKWPNAFLPKMSGGGSFLIWLKYWWLPFIQPYLHPNRISGLYLLVLNNLWNNLISFISQNLFNN
jgi:hypothetical protein